MTGGRGFLLARRGLLAVFLGVLGLAMVGGPVAMATPSAVRIPAYDSLDITYDIAALVVSPLVQRGQPQGQDGDGVQARVASGVATRQSVSSLATGVAAETALPEALSIGKNAETGVNVYTGVREGKDVYVGITNSLARRGAAHGDRFAIERLTDSSVTRGEGRAIEQAQIVRNPGFENIRNSISPDHPWYQQGVDWGEGWLQAGGH